jgi:cytochrome c5
VNVEAEAQADPEGEPAQPAANPALLRQGRQVFSNTCMLCHDLGPRIAGLGWTQARMERQIRRGGKRMSAISIEKLPNSKLHALMAYLRTIGAVRGDGS